MRGVGYRPVDFLMVSPSGDLGRIAADAYHGNAGDNGTRSVIGSLIKRRATMGGPVDEADFLSYIYFDNAYTDLLVDLGREDAKAMGDRILALLTSDPL